MSILAHLLERHRDEILGRWTSWNRGVITTGDLHDRVPQLLDDIKETLLHAESTSRAGRHAVRRFRPGFDLDAVAREYGILHQCILRVARDRSVPITLEEHDVLVQCMSDAIADAITQYSEQRDAQLLQQANEHFAFIAHELRHPLTSALLAWRSMKEKDPILSSALGELVIRSLARVKDLIENALGKAIVREATELRLERFAVAALVAEALAECEAAAAHKEIRIDFRPPAEEVELEADRRLLYSALTNVVSNAVKFSRHGGWVRIRWSADEDEVEIAVDDNCGGLRAGAIERMFAPFQEVGPDRSGFGLGLAIARQAVRAHGGTIRARNHSEGGCTLVIDLPIRRPASPHGRPSGR
jgi:signal transduction histidine kinase